MKKNRIILTCVALFTLFSANAQQDVHFSQFWAAPLTINPASAGMSGSDLRAILNYRSQWASVGEPYTTMGASVDMPLFKKMKTGMFGLGLNFIKDDAGDSKFSTVNPNLSLAYHLDLSGGQGTDYLSVGFLGGLIQRSINEDNLYWDSQWDGSGFNTNAASNETGGSLTVEAFDMSTGIHYFSKPAENQTLFAGVSFAHILSPNVAFEATSDKLIKKVNIHGGGEIPLSNSNTSILPNVMYSIQGSNRYLNAGGELKYILKENSHYTNYSNEISAAIGGYYRFGDAAYVASRLNWLGISLGLSYDFNLSELSTATSGNGGFELSLMYNAFIGAKSGRVHNVRFK